MRTDKKENLWSAFIGQWVNILNFKDTASRRQYWYVVAVDAIVAVLAIVIRYLGCKVLEGTLGDVFATVGIVLAICLIILMLPLISLTIRRLHDTGKSGWWMFLVFIIGIGTVILMFMCSNDADEEIELHMFDPAENIVEEVYGPPEMFDDSYSDEEDIQIYEEYDPGENMNPMVYGPPEMFN